MGWTPFQLHQYELKRKPKDNIAGPGAVKLEIPLHNRIIEHCNSQWPRWKYIHANPSAKSTIQTGCQDFTLFLPSGRLVCIEVKAKGGKRSEAQNIWAKEMEMLGHTVHLVFSFDQYLNLVK